MRRVQFVGHGEYDVEVVGVEQFLLPCFDPSFASLRLALRTASVTAGVIGDTCLVTAAQTHIEVSSEGSGAATADCPERLELLEIEAGEVAFQESVALRTEDISDLHGGPAHGFCGRRKARRLSSTLGLDHLRTYQAYLLKQRKLAVGSVVNHVAALRFLYVRTLKRPEFPVCRPERSRWRGGRCRVGGPRHLCRCRVWVKRRYL